jgi:hypothetical protein
MLLLSLVSGEFLVSQKFGVVVSATLGMIGFNMTAHQLLDIIESLTVGAELVFVVHR